jgi:hypothetical protein
MSPFSQFFHRIGFWLLITALLGASAGGYGIYKFNEWQTERDIRIGGMIFHNELYSIEGPLQVVKKN